jgi:hypothetical protein
MNNFENLTITNKKSVIKKAEERFLASKNSWKVDLYF